MARILVVDDQAENRDLLAYLLGYYGHTVSVAADGAAGVRAALADPPDLVLMDIAMPVIDGLAAARQMRSHPELANTPLIAISATGTITLETIRASGFDGFYPIPIDAAHFVAQLEPFLTPSNMAQNHQPSIL
jgi:two-component system, cell cycle response regulator DivK